MTRTLFISYSHRDNEKHQWLQRLNGFFDAVKEHLPIDVWADDRIGVGENWRREIETAISQAAAAVLLVGPGFLGSKFIRDQELPELIRAKEAGTVQLYPLVVAYCPWELSILEPYQAYNTPNEPLENMSEAKQNQWMNDLVIAIATEMRNAKVLPVQKTSSIKILQEAVDALRNCLEVTRTAFITQSRLRNNLVYAMQKRLQITTQVEYELFFIRYFDLMEEEERFEFNKIRALTEGLLHNNNRKIFEIITTTPGIREELPILGALKLHLDVWLNKYDKVFIKSEKMSVLYVGVEEGIPFPVGVDKALADWSIKNRN